MGTALSCLCGEEKEKQNKTKIYKIIIIIEI